jgi:hypothetical protein
LYLFFCCIAPTSLTQSMGYAVVSEQRRERDMRMKEEKNHYTSTTVLRVTTICLTFVHKTSRRRRYKHKHREREKESERKECGERKEKKRERNNENIKTIIRKLHVL